MSDESAFSFSLALREGLSFSVDFGAGIPPIIIDEPPPLGQSEGPSPSRLLAASIAGCLGASLLFCLRKSRVDVTAMPVDVHVTTGRNARGRLRVQKVSVQLSPCVPADQHERMQKCLSVFEDFCTVTASVREGMTIETIVTTQAA